jgi:intracellular multiplication protein IcmL
MINAHEDALELIELRNAFYKNQFYFVLVALLVSSLVILLLVFINLQIYHNATKPLYFIANDESRLIEEPNLLEPLPDVTVSAWLTNAIEASTSFDFVNYRSQLQGAQKYFIDFAWEEYMQGLTASNNLLSVINRQEIWITKVLKATITNSRPIGSSYAWRFNLYVKETRLKKPTYEQKPATTSVAYYKMAVVLQRMPILKSYHGLAILSMIKQRVSEAEALSA